MVLASNIKKILFTFFAIIYATISYAQYGETTSDQKAKLLYDIPRTLLWENDEDISVIYIGIILDQGSEPLVKALHKYAKKPYPNSGTRVIIKSFGGVESAAADNQINLLYAPQAADFKYALLLFKHRASAIVTDNCSDPKNIMINFITEKSGQVSFQYSSANLRKCGISIHENITKVLHGDDVSKDDIIRTKDDQLKNTMSELGKKEAELATKQREVDQKEREISQKQKTIDEQNKNIVTQSKAIKDQESRLNVQKAEMQRLLVQQEQTKIEMEKAIAGLNAKNAEVTLVESELAKQKSELVKQQQIAAEQLKHIEQVNKEISDKEMELSALNIKYQLLNNILTVSIIVCLVFLLMGAYIWFLFRAKRRDNKKLEAQNIQIEHQKKELEKLSIVADKTSSAVMILDKEGNFEWLNEGFSRLYGFDLDSLIQTSGKNIRTASRNTKIKEIISTVVDQHISMLYENAVVTKAGELKWAQTSITPVVSKDGSISKIILIDSDITALKNAHEEIRQQKEEIEAQKEQLELINIELEKLSLVASKTDNSVIIAQSNGEIEWVNDGFERMTGYNFQKYKEKFGVNLLEKNTEKDVLDSIEEGLMNKKSTIYTTKSHHADGSELWIQTNLTPIFDREKLYKIVAIDSDITQIKKAEEEIAKQKDKIIESILYASRIQQAVMPPEDLFSKFLPQHFILLKPRDIVSGDFYWAMHSGDKFFFTAADCTGHGVPGAFMSLLGIAFLTEIVGKSYGNISPGEVLTQLRQHIMQYLRQEGKEDEQKDGMDMALCAYSNQTRKLEYAGAHNPLIMIRNNEMIQTDADEMPIGYYVKQTDSFVNHEIDIFDNDIIYLFSDGYVDQFGMTNGRRKKYMIKRFREYLMDIHNQDLKMQKKMLDDNIENYRGDLRQMDDILVMGVKF